MRNNGYSLVETTIAIAIASLILGTLAPVISALFQADRAMHQQLILQRSIHRSGQNFREDVRMAIAEPSEDNEEGVRALTIQTAERRHVSYRIEAGHILRTVRSAGQIEHRDAYRFPGKPSVDWRVISDATPPVARLTLQIFADEFQRPDEKGKVIAIEAIIGADRRFGRSSADSS